MANRNPPQHDETTRERRTPLTNDVDPDGMDEDAENDELDASQDGDSVDVDEPDGTPDPVKPSRDAGARGR